MARMKERLNEDHRGRGTSFYHDGTKWYAHTSSSVIRETLEKNLLSLQTRSTSGDTTASSVDAKKYGEAMFFLDVTAATGLSPTLDVSIKTKDPTSGKWFDLVSFTQATGATQELKSVSNSLGSEIAVFYTLGTDTTDVTFSVGSIFNS